MLKKKEISNIRLLLYSYMSNILSLKTIGRLPCTWDQILLHVATPHDGWQGKLHIDNGSGRDSPSYLPTSRHLGKTRDNTDKAGAIHREDYGLQ